MQIFVRQKKKKSATLENSAPSHKDKDLLLDIYFWELEFFSAKV